VRRLLPLLVAAVVLTLSPAAGADTADQARKAAKAMRGKVDLTDDQAERIVKLCKDNPRSGQCGMFALLCAKSAYELGSTLHGVCKTFRLVAPRAGLSTSFGATLGSFADPALVGDVDRFATVGARSRGVVRALHLALGLDSQLGGGFNGGFVYRARVGAGLGRTFARTFAAGLLVGLGIDGITGDRVPLAAEVPVELFVSGNVGPYNHFLVWARNSFVYGSEARDGGADAALFGDEMSLGIGIGLGKNRVAVGHWKGRGVLLGVEYRELMGTSSLGFTLAYSSSSHGDY
jgi:hypothetical protein